MATQLKIEVDNTSPMLVPVAVPEVEIPTLNQQVALILTKEPEGDKFYDRIKEKVGSFVADVSTKKGRDECIAMAAKVTRTKTLIESSSKELTEEARAFTNSINAARKPMVERLAALAAEVRRPVTEWEEAEKARAAECEAVIARLRSAALIMADDTLETVLARGAEVKATVIDAERYGTLFDQATEAKKAAFYALKEAHGRLTKEAEERAEAKRIADRLAELEAENSAREQREADERQREQDANDVLKRQSDYASAIIRHIRECREARIDGKTYAWAICLNDVENRIETGDEAVNVFGDRADEVAREASEASVCIRQQMADEVERHRKEAADLAAQEARDQADREREEERREEQADAQAKIDEANARARALEEAEEQRKADEAAELQRIADQEAEEAAERQRLADDRRHQMALNVEAIRVIVTFGISKEAAGHLVDAVRDGSVPHLTWEA